MRGLRQRMVVSPMPTSRRKRMEFMQKVAWMVTLFSLAIVAMTISLNFFLLWNDKQPMPEETVAMITTYGGVASTVCVTVYGALTAARNLSLNKIEEKKIEVGGCENE